MNDNAIDILILAGGKAQRLNGIDKGLAIVNGKPLIQHCIERLCIKNSNLIISANRNQQEYARYGDHIVSDINGDFSGPLAGIYSALNLMRNEHLLVIPCDMPFFPLNLYSELKNKIANNDACAVTHNNHIEPLLLLVRRSHISSIVDYLDNGHRSVIGWLKESQCSYLEKTSDPIQFFNINSPQDIEYAETLMKKELADTENLFLSPVLQ